MHAFSTAFWLQKENPCQHSVSFSPQAHLEGVHPIRVSYTGVLAWKESALYFLAPWLELQRLHPCHMREVSVHQLKRYCYHCSVFQCDTLASHIAGLWHSGEKLSKQQEFLSYLWAPFPSEKHVLTPATSRLPELHLQRHHCYAKCYATFLYESAIFLRQAHFNKSLKERSHYFKIKVPRSPPWLLFGNSFWTAIG